MTDKRAFPVVITRMLNGLLGIQLRNFYLSPSLSMKRNYAVVLLACFVFPILATYAWLHLERRSIKREVKQEVLGSIDLEDCVRFEFTHAQEMNLDWEHSAEFSYNNQKYDVILKKRTKSGVTLYYCWKDVKESAIEKKIALLVNQALGGNPAKDKQHKSVTHLVKDLPVEEPNLVVSAIIPHLSHKGGHYEAMSSGSDLKTTSPPPEFGGIL